MQVKNLDRIVPVVHFRTAWQRVSLGRDSRPIPERDTSILPANTHSPERRCIAKWTETVAATSRASADREPGVIECSGRKGELVPRSRAVVLNIHRNSLNNGGSRVVKAFAILLMTIAVALPAAAQHPYLWLDATEINFMRGKVNANSADWQALEAQCDAMAGVNGVPYAVLYPSGNAAGNSLTRGYSYDPAGTRGVIAAGYYGGGWDTAMDELGACYQAIRTTDPVRAAAYLAEAHQIIFAMGQPLLQMVRASDGLTRYAVSINGNSDLTDGQQVQVDLPYNSALTIGDIWTISGATGCSNLNGTFKISSIAGSSVYFTNPDGSAATISGNCTLYSVSPTAGSAFGARFYMPALAKAYDWFYGDFINGGLIFSYPADLITLSACMTGWATEMQYVTYGAAPEQNYVAGYIWGATAAYVAFQSDQPAAIGIPASNVLAAHFSNPYEFGPYNNMWLGGGGNGEGLQGYGYDSIRRILDAEFALKLAGVDWTTTPYNFTFLDDNLQYFMEFTTPSKLSLDDDEYVFAIGAVYVTTTSYEGQWFPTEPVYIPLGDAAMYTAIARRFNSKYTSNFQGWFNTVYAAEQEAAGVLVPEWNSGVYQSQPDLADSFLWYDPDAPSSDWTVSPLMYRAWSGNYAVTRSDWSNTATEVTLLGGPTVGAAGNGKTQFDSGAVTIQTGNNRLLVYGLGEASRAADIITAYEHNVLQDERGTYGNKKNSIFWAGANTSETRNQGLTSRTPPPGDIYTVTSWPSSIDRAEDETAYTYFRASHLEANNAKSSVDGDYHQLAWTREVFFLRPKLVIVHDRTTVLNDTDDRAMFWTFGRNIAQVSANVPAGVTRYDATFNGIYRGAFWSVLPAAADVTIVDHDDLHFLYRAEVRPGAMDHTADNWLAVFDAAANAQLVNAVTSVSATNADAVQFNDVNASIVAFANVDPHTSPSESLSWPLNGSTAHYILGLTPGASYGISTANGELTVSATGPFQASASGVLVYQPVCRLLTMSDRMPTSWLRHAIFCERLF